MGKTVMAVVGVVAAVAVAVAAPWLAGMALGVMGIAATGTALAIATGVVGLTLSMGLALGMRALGVGAPRAENQVGPPQIFRQTISDSFIVYGQRRVGGLMVFYHPRQSGDDYFRYFVVACAGHRCKGVVTWMLGDEEVTVDGSGMVTSGKYADAAWLWFQRGLASETANATFVAECGGKWTADHKGNGIAAIYAKFQMTDDVIQAGMPNITAVIEGRDEIRDPRTGVEGYSRNASMIFYDWLKIAREEGGFGAYPDEIPDDVWQSAQANVCDEAVNGLPRYAIDAVLTTGASPAEVRDTLIVNMAGSYTYSGGKHLMRPGYWVPVSATLSEDDLAGPIQVSPFATSDTAVNEVQGTYISTGDGYQGMPFATRSVPATDIHQMNLDLAFVTNHDQATRVADIMLKRAQAEKTVVWPMNIAGLKVRALDTVQLNSSRYGLGNYAWVVANWGLSADFGVVLSLREESEDIYTDAVAVTSPSTPTIDTATPVPLSSEITHLISTSYIIDSDPLDGLLQATDTTITIEDHTRVYADKEVPVTGGTVTGLTAEMTYHVYYDDGGRTGGAVTYVATNYGPAAASSSVNPARHYVGTITMDVTGGTGTSGGGTMPPGWNGNDFTSTP